MKSFNYLTILALFLSINSYAAKCYNHYQPENSKENPPINCLAVSGMFIDSQLTGHSFIGTHLTHQTQFRTVIANSADFENSTFAAFAIDSNFDNTNFYNATISSATFDNVSFAGADFRGARFFENPFMPNCNLTGAKFDDSTVFNDNFTREMAEGRGMKYSPDLDEEININPYVDPRAINDNFEASNHMAPRPTININESESNGTGTSASQ